jgi:hypothetical protein
MTDILLVNNSGSSPPDRRSAPIPCGCSDEQPCPDCLREHVAHQLACTTGVGLRDLARALLPELVAAMREEGGRQ